MNKLRVISVRYFETNRGLGYQAKTNVDGIDICNDGTGGCTYLDGSAKVIADYKNLDWDSDGAGDKLEVLIDQYEGVTCDN